MYKALYRTWRPEVFEDIIGQEHITTTLKNQVKTGKIAHSYLFTGSRGIGKTTSAKVFAMAINCLSNEDGNPCGKCKNCIDFKNGALTDTVEMDAASNNGVDDIRALREEAIFLPAIAKYRIYIIDETHMLSKGAFNALLKIMEEPPEHVIFILATTELNKVPATIISRCQRFDFFRVNPQEIADMLLKISEKEKINLNKDAALNIGLIANGSVRDAISLLDQTASLGEEITQDLVNMQAGTADKRKIMELSGYIIDGNFEKTLVLIDELYKLSVDLKNISKELIVHFRNLMLTKELENTDNIVYISDYEKEIVKSQAERVSFNAILHAIEILTKMHPNLTGEIEAKALFESVLLRLTKPNLDSSLEGILKRLSKVEKSLENAQDSGFNIETSIKTILKETTKSDDKPPFEVLEDKKEIHEEKTSVTIEAEKIVKDTDITDRIEKIEEINIPETLKEDVDEFSEEESVLQVDEKLILWKDIMDLLKKRNPPLEATLEGSKAYLKGDIVLIDAPNTVFFDLMRASDQTKESLRQAIEAVTGQQYRLGPVKQGTTVEKNDNNILDIIKEQAKNLGINIEEKK